MDFLHFIMSGEMYIEYWPKEADWLEYANGLIKKDLLVLKLSDGRIALCPTDELRQITLAAIAKELAGTEVDLDLPTIKKEL